MIKITSPKIKTAQPRKPWEFDEEELEDLEEIEEPTDPFRPAEERDFRPWEFTEEEAEDLEPLPAEPEAPPGLEVKPMTDFSFLPFAPSPDADKMPVDPDQVVGDEVAIPTTPIEDANEDLDVREMIFYSLNNSTPLRIKYTTLDGGADTERTVHPDYVYWAGTNRHVLVAWDELRNDWRAFAVNNINMAKLMEETQ